MMDYKVEAAVLKSFISFYFLFLLVRFFWSFASIFITAMSYVNW